MQKEDLMAASHLKENTPITQKDILEAAQHLNDTGVFSDIHYSFNGADLTFKLTPASTLLPVRYNNFLWWQTEELDTALHKRVPLFQGKCGVSGMLTDAITAALTAMLAEKGITATVEAMPYSPKPGAPIEAIGFTITSPAVLVHNLTLEGASAGMTPHLQPALHRFASLDFDANLTQPSITSVITAIYYDYGYLDADVPGILRGQPTLAGDHFDVDVVANVTEGDLYHLTRLDWPGSEVCSTADFQKIAKMKPGDVASQAELRDTLRTLKSAYTAKGYMEAKIHAAQAKDQAAHTVSYAVSVEPGVQYHIEAVKTPNLTEQQQKEFDKVWLLKPGDIYDENYVSAFLKKSLDLRSLAGYSGAFKSVGDPYAHTVVVTITFVKGGVLTQ